MFRIVVTDEALMLAVRDGDLGKLGALFERYHGALFDFLSRTTGDPSAADDLVQEVFVRILKYRHTFRDESCFETWMFRIARNTKHDYFTRRRTTDPLDDMQIEIPAPGPGPAQQLERRRDADRLKRALLLLDDDDRELLVLARYQNMKYERIGALLGIEVGAVKVRVHRAMKALRNIFQRLAEERTSHAM
jgi:RNA polymerase sigma-70 factor (ECF subfamily)